MWTEGSDIAPAVAPFQSIHFTRIKLRQTAALLVRPLRKHFRVGLKSERFLQQDNWRHLLFPAAKNGRNFKEIPHSCSSWPIRWSVRLVVGCTAILPPPRWPLPGHGRPRHPGTVPLAASSAWDGHHDRTRWVEIMGSLCPVGRESTSSTDWLWIIHRLFHEHMDQMGVSTHWRLFSSLWCLQKVKLLFFFIQNQSRKRLLNATLESRWGSTVTHFYISQP